MKKITSLGGEPKQELTILLNDNSRLVLRFEYKANQLGWFFGFDYNNNSYNNIRLTTSYNILRGYRNWLPFGLRCDTLDGFEPTDLDDFATGYATIYVLDKQELNTIESLYYAKIS